MAEISLLMPPLAFLVVIGAGVMLALGLSRLRLKTRDRAKGQGQPYACGEDIPSHMLRPDYGQFLPFAVFFTILHVVALTLTTVPSETIPTFVIAVVYLSGAVIGLTVLYRR